MNEHPVQPVLVDTSGMWRFKSNAIVTYLLDNGGIDMNAIAMRDFSPEDRVQFAQLIGYSVGGFCELSYVSNEEIDRVLASALANESLDLGNPPIAQVG